MSDSSKEKEDSGFLKYLTVVIAANKKDAAHLMEAGIDAVADAIAKCIAAEEFFAVDVSTSSATFAQRGFGIECVVGGDQRGATGIVAARDQRIDDAKLPLAVAAFAEIVEQKDIDINQRLKDVLFRDIAGVAIAHV